MQPAGLHFDEIGLNKDALQEQFVFPAVGDAVPIASAARFDEATAGEERTAGLVRCPHLTPELVQAQHLAGIAANRLDGIRGIALLAMLGGVNQNPDAGVAVEQVQFEKVECTDRLARRSLNDEPLLTGLQEVILLLVEEALVWRSADSFELQYDPDDYMRLVRSLMRKAKYPANLKVTDDVEYYHAQSGNTYHINKWHIVHDNGQVSDSKVSIKMSKMVFQKIKVK